MLLKRGYEGGFAILKKQNPDGQIPVSLDSNQPGFAVKTIKYTQAPK
jgi:hypothetical protein